MTKALTNTTIIDAGQRLEALDTSKSFAVSAPAGSGKTGLLTQRVLKLLAQAQNPEEILCLTFTRKAAAEMRHRIHKALVSATSPEPDNDFEKLTWQLARKALQQDTTQGWQLINSPNRLRITTIDSFCRNLTQQLAPESGISEGIATLDNAEHLYAQAVEEVLLGYLESSNTIGNAIRTLLSHQDNNLEKLNNLLISLLYQREQWLEHLLASGNTRQRLESFLQQTINDTLGSLRQQLLPFAGDIVQCLDYAASNLIDSGNDSSPILEAKGIEELPQASAEHIPQWLAVTELLLTAKHEWRKGGGINKKLGFPTAKDDPELGDIRKAQIKQLLEGLTPNQALRDALTDVRHLPFAQYPEEQWQVLEALSTLLPLTAAQLRALFVQNNQCDFTEITLAAIQALGDDEEPTELALRLDYQINHILIDEFQDTSTIQYRLLTALTRGWQGDDGRSLFIVGDAMQSLYGFRNANVSLFLEARTRPIGAIQLQALDLQTNFRSARNVVDWVNQAFTGSFPSKDNINRGAVRYNPAFAVKPEYKDPAVTINAYEGFETPEEEAKQVEQYVSQAKQENPTGSIAILVRDRGYLKYLLPVLRQAGHRWSAKDIEPLSSQMTVIDLQSLTKALLNPADRIAWLSVLRAPWAGINLKDLHTLCTFPIAANPTPKGVDFPLIYGQIQHHQLIEGLSEEALAILDRITPHLIHAWQQRQRNSLRSTIESLWLALGGEQLAQHQQTLSSAHTYFNLLEQHEQAGTIENWALFNQAVEKLYAEPLPDSDPLLQIMTIHKAKGLEFDTVIIPGMNRRPPSANKALMVWREGVSQSGQQQLIISPVESTGNNTDATYKHLKYEQKNKEHLENTRVMYVAATRAIKQLHLLYTVKSKPTAGSLLDSIWPWLSQQLDNQNTDHKQAFIINQKVADAELESAQKQNKLPRLASLSRLKHAQHQPIAELREENSIEFEENAEQRIAGTLLHRILRQITLDGIGSWSEQTIDQRKASWALQLRQAGSQHIEENTNRLEQAVKHVFADTQNHWIFNHTFPQSYCEHQIDYLKDNYPKTVIIDRTFIDNRAEPTRWIIDYKLSEPNTGESGEAFKQRLIDTYQDQLAHYANILNQQEVLPTKTALYLPQQGYLLTI